MPEVRLDAVDAAELAELLQFPRVSHVRAGLLPVRHCPRRPEPVKSACGVPQIGYADS